MKVLFEIGHPKDVNVFKNVIQELQCRGHKVKIIAKDKENIKKILDEYGLQYELGPYYKNIFSKAFGFLFTDIKVYIIAKKFQPHIFVSPGSPYSAQVSWILRKPHIAFPDTEIAIFSRKLMYPFTEKIFTSVSFYLDMGPKQKRFNGYYELAYLHPKYFTPRRQVLEKYGLKSQYIVLRLSALSAHHDVGVSGFSFKTENELKNYIQQLEAHGKVLISSETLHWQTIKDYQLDIDPRDLHDILYYAKLYIGEGATMASEAAVLGTPAIYVSNTRRGYLDELEEKYDMAYTIPDRRKALEKAVLLLQDSDLKQKWQQKREKMLGEKIDTVEFMVGVIEGYAPEK